jgi:transposase
VFVRSAADVGLNPHVLASAAVAINLARIDPGRAAAGVDGLHGQLDHPRPSTRRRWKKGGPDHAIGRSRGGLSTKINAVVDENGLPIRLSLSAGQTSDKAAAPALIDSLTRTAHVVADRGYDAMALVDQIRSCGARTHIPTQRDRKVQRSVDHAIYRQRRNLVERYFNKLNAFKIATPNLEQTIHFGGVGSTRHTHVVLLEVSRDGLADLEAVIDKQYMRCLGQEWNLGDSTACAAKNCHGM